MDKFKVGDQVTVWTMQREPRRIRLSYVASTNRHNVVLFDGSVWKSTGKAGPKASGSDSVCELRPRAEDDDAMLRRARAIHTMESVRPIELDDLALEAIGLAIEEWKKRKAGASS